MILRAVAALIVAVALTSAVDCAVAQQNYPGRPVRVVVPYPPGGSTDPTARMVTQKLTEKWAQSVIVDNRPGGNSIIGTNLVAKATPDGYTMLYTSSAFVTTPSLLPHLPYDTVRDFQGVCGIAQSRHGLVVNPSLPVANLPAFIALAKARPGELNYGSSGIGTGVHLAAELFSMQAGVRMRHIPYKGTGPLLTDLVNGQVQVTFPVPIAVTGFIASGRLKMLAVSGEKRLAILPDVPTFRESGVAGFERAAWSSFVVPAGTPRELIEKISRDVAAVLATPDIGEKMSAQGQEPFTASPEEVNALIRNDIAKYAKIIKAANIRVEQ